MPFNAKCPGCGSSDPCGCSDPYSDKTASSDVKYTGHNLSCINVNTCDDLSVVIQKINQAICVLQAAITPTTTTTSSSSTTSTSTSTSTTTTTTTTAAPTTTTTTSSSSTSTTTSTTTAGGPTTTTTTTTAAPTTTTTTSTSTSTSTTTSTSTSTSTSTTTSTTTAAPTFSQFTIYRDNVGSGWADSATACAATATGPYIVYTDPQSTTLDQARLNGDALHTDSGLTTIFNGGGLWYKTQIGPGGVVVRIDVDGFISIPLVTC